MQRRREEGAGRGMAALPALVAAGIQGSEPEEGGRAALWAPALEASPLKGALRQLLLQGGRKCRPSLKELEEASVLWREEEEAAELRVFIPHLVLAASSLEDPVSACVCSVSFLKPQRCRNLCHQNHILCLHTYGDGELTTTLPLPRPLTPSSVSY